MSTKNKKAAAKNANAAPVLNENETVTNDQTSQEEMAQDEAIENIVSETPAPSGEAQDEVAQPEAEAEAEVEAEVEETVEDPTKATTAKATDKEPKAPKPAKVLSQRTKVKFAAPTKVYSRKDCLDKPSMMRQDSEVLVQRLADDGPTGTKLASVKKENSKRIFYTPEENLTSQGIQFTPIDEAPAATAADAVIDTVDEAKTDGPTDAILGDEQVEALIDIVIENEAGEVVAEEIVIVEEEVVA